METLAEKWEIPSSETKQITLMTEELFSNIIRSAFQDKGDYKIELTLSKNEGLITLLISDDGIPFNPLEYNQDQLTDPISMDDGGMGLTLIRAFADSLEYSREEQKNLLLIKKTIRSSPES